MRQVMINVAKSERLITYSELCAMLKTAYIHFHSPFLTGLLIDIGREEHEAGRPILPAVVVSKTSGIPGAGYFKAGEGEDTSESTDDPKALWQADLERLYEYWSKHES